MGNRQNLFAKEPPMTVMDVTETDNETMKRLKSLMVVSLCLVSWRLLVLMQ